VIAIDSVAAQRVVGRYALSPAATLTVVRAGASLTVQLTGQPPFQLFPSAPGIFFLKAVDAQLEFELPADGGPAIAVTLVQGGARPKAARVP
jgi:hypothetical protein